MRKPTKKQILAIATTIFTLAAVLGSTILTPAQREMILQLIAAF